MLQENESRQRWIRVIGLLGLIGFALIVTAAVILPFWTGIHTNDAAESFARYARDQQNRILVAMFLYSLAFGLFLVLSGVVWIEIRRANSATDWVGAVFGIAAAAMSTMILVAFVPACVSAYRSHSPEISRMLFDLSFGALAFSGIPTAVCMAAYAVATLCFTTLPRWTGWVAAMGAIPHLVIAGSFLVKDGFFSLEGDVILWVPVTLFGWILAASTALLSPKN